MLRALNIKWAALPILSILLLGCSEEPQQTMAKTAVAIESADECHLCGMIISNFPGPKGEAYQEGKETINKFCSTKDLFAFILQPENTRQVREVFVHDMSKTPWHKPEDEYFINAKEAWFVTGSSQKGAMGPTLASFSTEQDAKVFIEEFGGELVRYGDITTEMLMVVHH